MKVDQSVIGGLNRTNILELIRTNESISRSELSKMTHLSLPTVMKITDDLIAKGLVIDYAKGESTGGKPPRLLKFNYQVGYIVGIDINYHRIDAILMDLNATVKKECSHDMHSRITGNRFKQILLELLNEVMDVPDIGRQQVLGIGISAKIGSGSRVDLLEKQSFFGFERQEIQDYLRRYFAMPIIFEDNVCAMAMGEKTVGSARQVENFLFIHFGYEIDSAIVIDRRIYHGSSGRAGGIGHFVVDTDGELCSCGKRGCLNTVAGQKAIGERAKEIVSRLKEGEYSMMLDMVFGNVDQINFYTVVEAAENGDKAAINILMEAVRTVGEAINNVVLLIDPDVIFVSGKIVDCSLIFMKNLREYVKNSQKGRDFPVEIEVSNLGHHVGAIGAASSVLKQFLKDGAI